MAMENKRIIQLNTERTTPASDDFVMVDSATDGTAKYQLSKITDAIDQEISDRTSADTTLQGNITAEATARTNADTTLQNNITAEATARAAADTAINGEITQLKEDLTDEITARESADDAINAELATKADTDGAIANAEQLLSDKYTIDQVPYTFRASGSDGADREYDEIFGGSIVWNQLVSIPPTSITATVNGVTYTDNRDGSYTINGTASANSNITIRTVSMNPGHVYLVQGFKNGSNVAPKKYLGFAGVIIDYGNGGIYKYTNTSATTLGVRIDIHNGGSMSDTLVKPQVFDLTAMFGSTIADYIYSLEQATAGAGVAWFKKFFPKDYYAYDAGTMMHVSGLSSHDMVGFNAWDISKDNVGKTLTMTGELQNASTNYSTSDYIRVVPDTQYYIKDVVGSSYAITGAWYDSDKTFISLFSIGGNYPVSGLRQSPINAAYARATRRTDSTEACINLHWDGERDGEYEPYVKHSYPLDDSLTLRGIPKLDSNNQLYYDGDVYAADGTVTRKYGIVDLGTLTWTTSSTNISEVHGYVTTSSIAKAVSTADVIANILCSSYSAITRNNVYRNERNGISIGTDGKIFVLDSAYASSTSTEFKTAMSGVYLVYELATPTTEEATPYNEIQIVDDFGTEEYVTTSLVPVGHYTKYPANLRSAIERVMEQVPEAPSANGTYTLKATRTSSGVTYAWTAE